MLPTGFHRIRYYGFLGARHRRAKLARCRQLLGPTSPITPPADARPRPTIATAPRRSPATPCGSAPCVITGRCS
ncbi:MAG: hypothetical protein M0C28_26195 [Candidatus Moduliflexus flocculans]|nr:hypothetical protein [Candidatus Moduliflexus flocculans]